MQYSVLLTRPESRYLSRIQNKSMYFSALEIKVGCAVAVEQLLPLERAGVGVVLNLWGERESGKDSIGVAVRFFNYREFDLGMNEITAALRAFEHPVRHRTCLKQSQHVAEIGPLPVNADTKYVAQYMEAIMSPGMETRLHRHPGPEAWYTEGGETCLETPEGKQVGIKGVSVIVPGGQPMRLSVTGTEQRRSLVLVLHDASQPWMTMASDWTPKGLCGK
jgi:quercetin dioxygenase-like cupin family protein